MDVQVYDNVVPNELKQSVWRYIQNQEWHVTWKPNNFLKYSYIPAVDDNWDKINPTKSAAHMFMPRVCFGNNETDLEINHIPIFQLWQTINQHLNNSFVINGFPEEISTTENSRGTYARVYANSQPFESIKRSHGIHRDSIELDNNSYYTILYFANLEWYPSWFAENIFYPDDNTTGDNQQFQSNVKFNQNRNYGIGWGDEGVTVSPKSGRIVVYNSKTLHTTKPSADWAEESRKAIVFRVQKLYH
jgi:hypothetical protein